MSTKKSSTFIRMIVAAAIILAACLTSNAQPLAKLTVPVDTLRTRAAADGKHYQELLDRFIAADTTLTVDEAALVYYGYYSAPIKRTTPTTPPHKLFFSAVDSLKADNYEAAYGMLTKLIEYTPVAAQDIYFALICAVKTGRKDDVERLKSKALMLAKAISASGNGMTPETAYCVNEINDEYFFLRDITHIERITGQRLETHNGQKYDVLTIEHKGINTGIYFRPLKITSLFDFENELK